jgi:hypothetical protein
MKMNKKLDIITSNHLHDVVNRLDDIRAELKGGFERLDNKLTKVAEDISVIKDRQRR